MPSLEFIGNLDAVHIWLSYNYVQSPFVCYSFCHCLQSETMIRNWAKMFQEEELKHLHKIFHDQFAITDLLDSSFLITICND
jgi:hypothetical protein